MSDEVPVKIYRLKIHLIHTKPPIWRRVLVPNDVKLDYLHLVIQKAMGWEQSHNWQFGDIGEKLSRHKKISEVLQNPKDEILYIYDYGDTWEHVIKLEKIQRPDVFKTYPICIAGNQACPPENSGGTGQYFEMRKILRDPSHPEYQSMLAWVREYGYEDRFKPDYKFDPRSVF